MKSDIILAGVGGQGILTIATLLGTAAMTDNLYLKQSEVHGMSQRGGDVQSNLRISSEPIHSDLIPLGGADLIVSMEPMEALRYLPYLSERGWIVCSTEPLVNIDNYPARAEIEGELFSHPRTIAFDMEGAAKEVASARSSNLVLLGAASLFVGLDAGKIEDAVTALFGNKGENVVKSNIAAFRLGRKRAGELRTK